MFQLSSSVSFLLLISISMSVIQCSVSEKFDAQKAIDSHSSCNGDPIIVPPEFAAGIVLAATNCFLIQDRYCAEQCTAYHYKGFVKGNKYDPMEIKRAGRTVIVTPKNEKAKAEILDAIDSCTANLQKMEKPTEKTESCPEGKKFMDCLEESYQVACKGKKKK